MITLDPDIVASARRGSRRALEEVVRALERPVFNLAIRMLAHKADAEDATQEILIKVVTHLGEVREGAAAGAWAFRVACRHLVHARQRGRLEKMRMTFRAFSADLADGAEDLPDTAAEDPETQIMIEEVKIGCTLALLTCLSRPLRAALVLGEVFELSDTEAADALEIEPAAYRQRLSRARSMVTAFVQARCGIVSPEAQCQCDRRVLRAARLGRVERGRPRLEGDAASTTPIAEVRARVAALEHGRAAVALLRSNPNFTTEVGALVLEVLGGA